MWPSQGANTGLGTVVVGSPYEICASMRQQGYGDSVKIRQVCKASVQPHGYVASCQRGFVQLDMNKW